MTGGLFKTRQTLAWIILMVITLASWFTGHAIAAAALGGALVLAMAFSKAAIVIFEFMEVRHAPRWLQLITAIWVASACALLVTLYLV